MVIAIYVSKQGDNYNPAPYYNDTAEKIQIADLGNKGKKTIYVSTDGINYASAPIYNNPAANFQFVLSPGSKSIFVSTDGISYASVPIYNNPASNFRIDLDSQPIPLITIPTEGFVKPGGWGANTDPTVWTVTNMKNQPHLFKVVDNQGKNVATDFTTQQKAMEYIAYKKWEQSRNSGIGGVLSSGGIVGRNVYRTTGKSQRAESTGFKTRHYASGKPDDTTIEFNAGNCPYEAYEAYGYFTIGQPEHDDKLDVKCWGPRHKDDQGAWYIFAINFSEGETSLGWEKPHPKTESDVVKGKAFGDIRGNREIGFKGVIWPLEGGGGHVEGYIDLMDGKGWQLGVSADNIGGKKFQKDGNQQVQFRIDAAPQLKGRDVIVEEIALPPQKVV